MRRRHALGAIAAACAGPLAAAAAPAARGDKVVWPDVALLDGDRFGAAQAAGQALVVVFWSSTCPFCRRHNEHIEKLHRAAVGRPLRVLGVARDKNPDAVRLHVAQRGYSFPITMAQAPMAAALSARRVIPLTVTVDRRGRLRQVIPGEMFEEDVMELLALADEEKRS